MADALTLIFAIPGVGQNVGAWMIVTRPPHEDEVEKVVVATVTFALNGGPQLTEEPQGAPMVNGRNRREAAQKTPAGGIIRAPEWKRRDAERRPVVPGYWLIPILRAKAPSSDNPSLQTSRRDYSVLCPSRSQKPQTGCNKRFTLPGECARGSSWSGLETFGRF